MAPLRGPQESSVEQPPDYAEFFEKLRAFHEQRGYVLVPALESVTTY